MMFTNLPSHKTSALLWLVAKRWLCYVLPVVALPAGNAVGQSDDG